MEESRLVIGSATDPGSVRDRNEDLVYFAELDLAPDHEEETYILAVADGMGGYERGDVASRMALDSLIERLKTFDTDDVSLILKQAYRRANELIYQDGTAHGEDNMMGTTLVAAVLIGDDLTIANVGDSRAYLLRAGTLNQITEDHSLIAEQVRMGVISADEARDSQHKNIITRALGHRPRVDVDVYELTLLPEDRVLLSSDGVHDFLEEDVLREVLAEMEPAEAAQELVARALANGSTDNLTALVAWMAPISVLERPAVEEAEPVSVIQQYLVPIIVAAGLIILVAIAILLLFIVG